MEEWRCGRAPQRASPARRRRQQRRARDPSDSPSGSVGEGGSRNMSSRHDSRSIGGGRPAYSTLFRAQTPAKLRRCLHQLDEAAARNGHCGGEDGRFPRGLPAVSSRAAPETGMTFRGRLIFRRKFASQGRQRPKRRSRWGPGKGRSGRGVGGGDVRAGCRARGRRGKVGLHWHPRAEGPRVTTRNCSKMHKYLQARSSWGFPRRMCYKAQHF